MERIGPIMILEGPNYSKVPFSRSLFIDCTEKVLIDSGADANQLLELDREYGVELIINTHYHPDHTLHNHLFRDATKLINPIEYETSLTIEGVASVNGVYQEWGPEGVEQWKKTLPEEWVKNLGEISGTYEYESNYSLGDVKVQFLHTPGHTRGLACPYFPELGVVFAGDYDMTSFGPWYNGSDGNIEDFIASGQRLLSLDADTYITGHQKGIFTKKEFTSAMETFLAIIDRRDQVIDQYAKQGMNFEELTNVGIFYPKKLLQNSILKTWERGGIRKHLERLGYTIEDSSIDLVMKK
ncbi:hydroxyacylglutathione hydrolase [Bacillus sp. SORGH_AS 510]|uniref:MBL fold metallo-hydrolase n=1 Tax=Bacillus sp. SORGH_AS_0510 TaxID=3041771 RepID=UPI002785E677|nr:MBL fold metallo-hydrolase [Bacillus sp. SORGH_AS_0510]MDQ1145375.1 hydroxyacylglutathione hydrolase [Bacillus sp. SORGH_AS_0510]